MEHILENIKRIRESQKITQAVIGEKLGISRVQYTNIESGITSLTMDRMQDIAEILGVEVSQLMDKPSAKVISFANRKGGVGKSTMTILFSVALSNWTDYKVLVIDTDSQSTVASLADEESDLGMDIIPFNFDESHTPIRDFLKIIEKKSKEYDLILIDTQGSFADGQAINTILSVSDICIIPIQATKPAIQSTLTTLVSLPEISEGRREEGKSFLALGIVNQRTRTNEHKIVKDLDGQFGMKVLDNALSNLVRYHREMSLSKPICEKEDDDEFVELFRELVKEIGL
ncbi:AAA family ATPase [Chondrinema litorale]|uniref:AAA family ATPase n=1 Tax=Chondrinema litorale TaxID=2994555 RepID=UPI002543B4AB|nr:AAA family ATPase [Chondrinema litorale]UZS00087.1 AAA family ATPase [Chondrinema litorale]